MGKPFGWLGLPGESLVQRIFLALAKFNFWPTSQSSEASSSWFSRLGNGVAQPGVGRPVGGCPRGGF